jgi:hypothetical protein
MSVVRNNTPNGYSIFCDDVRVEANGKQILIGVYYGDMLLPVMPVQLPIFSVVIRYNERVNESELPVKIVITVPGHENPVFSTEIPRENFQTTISSLNTDADVDDPLVTINVMAAFPGLLFSQPGRIKVRAYRGDDEIRLGTLRVRLRSEWEEEQKAITAKQEAAH